MSNKTKFLICILSSVLIINFLVNVGTLFTEIPILYEYGVMIQHYDNPEIKEYLIQALEDNKEYYEEMGNFVDEFSNELDEDKAAKGMLLEVANQIGKGFTIIDKLGVSIIARDISGFSSIYGICRSK